MNSAPGKSWGKPLVTHVSSDVVRSNSNIGSLFEPIDNLFCKFAELGDVTCHRILYR